MQVMQIEYTRKEKRKHFTILLLLIVCSLSVHLILPPTQVTRFDGTVEILSGWNAVKTRLIFHLFGMPIVAALLGLFVALLPYKGLSYGKKYLRAWILTLCVLYALTMVLGNVGLWRMVFRF